MRPKTMSALVLVQRRLDWICSHTADQGEKSSHFTSLGTPWNKVAAVIFWHPAHFTHPPSLHHVYTRRWPPPPSPSPSPDQGGGALLTLQVWELLKNIVAAVIFWHLPTLHYVYRRKFKDALFSQTKPANSQWAQEQGAGAALLTLQVWELLWTKWQP